MLPEHPTHRPLERFWPYAELSEAPSDEELAALHPELREALFSEIKGRILETDLSLPSPWGPWLYYQRTTAGEGNGLTPHDHLRASFGSVR